MAFNISEFQSAMSFDGARPNLFQVTIPVFDQKLTFTCKTAQLPGSTLGVIEVPYFGRAVKLAGNRTFPEWVVTVINDEDFLIRNQLEEWMASINTHETNLATDLFQGYSFDASVVQYGKQGDIIKDYTFVGMFPTDLSPIELDWGSNDTIEEYSITFQYQYWTSNQVAVG
jgi:hypothetical protein